LESKEYEDRLREIVKDLDSTSKVFPLITLFFLFILVVNPFIIEDVINGEWGYAAEPSDVVFITNILGYYSYGFFIVFAVFFMILGSLAGMFMVKVFGNLIKVKNTKDLVEKWDKKLCISLALTISITFLIGLIRDFCGNILAIGRNGYIIISDGLFLYLQLSMLMGACIYTYREMKNLSKLFKEILKQKAQLKYIK